MFRFCCILILLGVTHTSFSASDTPFKTKVYEIYSPAKYQYVIMPNGTKQPTYYTNIINKVSKLINVKLDISLVPFKRAVKMVERDKGLIVGMSPSTYRAKTLSFSKKIRNYPHWLVVRKENKEKFEKVDLSTLRVLHNIRLDLGQKQRLKAGPKFQYDELIPPSRRWGLLMNNHFDASTFNGLRYGNVITEIAPDEELLFKEELAILDDPIYVETIHFAYSHQYAKDNTEFINLFNQAIQELWDNGTIKEAMDLNLEVKMATRNFQRKYKRKPIATYEGIADLRL